MPFRHMPPRVTSPCPARRPHNTISHGFPDYLPSFGSGICFRFASKAHLPTSAPFRTRAPARYPASYTKTIREEFPILRPLTSCCLSAAGIRFLSTLSCQGIQPPLRSAYRTACAYPRLRCGPWHGFHVPHARDPDRAGRSLYPGDSGAHRPRTIRGRRLPPLNGWSLPPRRHNPARSVNLTRHQQEFPGSRPIPVLPLTCGHHDWSSGPWAFP